MILPWKKSEPPPAFVADPAKAARYAEKAREAMRKGEWTYSLTMFAMSVKFDPNNLVVHGEMYDAAMAHHNAGGKAAASSANTVAHKKMLRFRREASGRSVSGGDALMRLKDQGRLDGPFSAAAAES